MLSRGNDESNSYHEWYPLNTHFGKYGHTKLEFCFVFLYFSKIRVGRSVLPQPKRLYRGMCTALPLQLHCILW